MNVNLGTGWKSYTGLGLAFLAFVCGQFGIVSPDLSTWGEAIGALFAAFGLRHKLG